MTCSAGATLLERDDILLKENVISIHNKKKEKEYISEKKNCENGKELQQDYHTTKT